MHHSLAAICALFLEYFHGVVCRATRMNNQRFIAFDCGLNMPPESILLPTQYPDPELENSLAQSRQWQLFWDLVLFLPIPQRWALCNLGCMDAHQRKQRYVRVAARGLILVKKSSIFTDTHSICVTSFNRAFKSTSGKRLCNSSKLIWQWESTICITAW